MKRERDPSGRRFEPQDMECLLHHLRRQLGGESIHRSPGEDPPDFWLTVGKSRYAVEVTSIADMRPDDESDVRSYYPHSCQLAQRIEKGAGADLSGFYALRIYGNPTIPKGRQAKGLIEAAICYIRRTRDDVKAHPEQLFTDRVDIIEIHKVGPCLRLLYREMAGGVRFWPRSVFVLCSASDGRAELSRVIKEKLEFAHKFRQQGNCAGPILLIHNCCELNLWPEFKQAASHLKEVRLFHSIFLIQGTLSPDLDRTEFVPHCLHTQNPFWETME